MLLLIVDPCGQKEARNTMSRPTARPRFYAPTALAIALSLAVGGSLVWGFNSRTAANSVNTVIDDMTRPHQGRPRGVPDSYDWVKQPRIGMGNNPKQFRAMIAAGQLYEDAKGNPATNTRVQIRNMRAYVLSKKDNQWHLIQDSNSVQGQAFREDFAGNVSKPAQIRPEQDGGISVKTSPGYNFHFWSATGRASINPQDIKGVFTTVEARLVTDDPKRPDDRLNARYLLSMAGDYWLDEHVAWQEFKTNGDIAIGRFKWVTPQWQSFNMTSLSPEDLRRNPPPLTPPPTSRP